MIDMESKQKLKKKPTCISLESLKKETKTTEWELSYF